MFRDALPHPKTLVSVCIPTFNARPFILDTLQSVLCSHHLDLEVVVSDDASSDGTAELVASLGDPRLRVFRHQSRVGPAANWNRAIEQSCGDFVGLLNHDDLFGPFWISAALAAFKVNPRAGWAMSAYRVINAAGHTISTQSRFRTSGVYEGRALFETVARLRGLGPGFIARREVLRDVGRYDESTGASADTDLFLRLASRHPLYYATFPHNAWRLHDTNLTHSWQLTAQAREGARMLTKAFSDPHRPAWVDECRTACLAAFQHSCQRAAAILEARGETTPARETREALASLLPLIEAAAPLRTSADPHYSG